MSSYILSCCSTTDLSKEHLEARRINYICFRYEINGVQYADDLGASVSFPDFYQSMEQGAITRTSQINIDEYSEYFESFFKEGMDVLHVTLSGGLSGSINSANIAAGLLSEKYPDRKLIIIDSLGASSGYGMLMDRAADLRDSGMDIQDLAQWIEHHKLNVQHWFFSTTLKYYVRGGRLSRTSGFLGEALGICPLLHVDAEGKLVPVEKVRSKNKVRKAIVKKMIEFAEDGTEYSGKCYISHSNCLEDAAMVAEEIEATFPHLVGHVEINNIGTVIGSHSGPGTVALFFWGKTR